MFCLQLVPLPQSGPKKPNTALRPLFSQVKCRTMNEQCYQPGNVLRLVAVCLKPIHTDTHTHIQTQKGGKTEAINSLGFNLGHNNASCWQGDVSSEAVSHLPNIIHTLMPEQWALWKISYHHRIAHYKTHYRCSFKQTSHFTVPSRTHTLHTAPVKFHWLTLSYHSCEEAQLNSADHLKPWASGGLIFLLLLLYNRYGILLTCAVCATVFYTCMPFATFIQFN